MATINQITVNSKTYDLAVSAANVSGTVANATTATKLGTATKGSATIPIYLNEGAPTACTYSLAKSVPADAVFTDTNTKVTSVSNHYTPTANESYVLSADASSTTAATWNSTSLVTGVNLQRDAKGHVTGVSVDSIKMPSKPSTSYTLPTASSSTLGGVKVGTGLGISSGTLSVSYGTTATTACKGNDSRLSDSRTPKAHASSATTYGAGTASNYGHVKLSDSYTTSSGTAAYGVAASSYALVTAYNTLNSKLGDSSGKLELAGGSKFRLALEKSTYTMNFRGYLNDNDYLQFRTGNKYTVLEQCIDGTVTSVWESHALCSTYVYKDVITNSDPQTWGGNYKYFDINSEVVKAIGNISRLVAIIPLSATHTSTAGLLGLLGNYTYTQGIRDTAFVINAGFSGTYRAKFLVLYR